MSWFENLFGFNERHGEVRDQISVSGDKMTSRVNGATYTCGTFETPSLEELRARGTQNKVKERVPGEIKVSMVAGDVAGFIAQKENRYALFQAASQFNCLEFPGPSVVPEMGVTGYVGDHTQGPACSVACGPATVYRNYFVPLAIPPPPPMMLIGFNPKEEGDSQTVQGGRSAEAAVENFLAPSETKGEGAGGVAAAAKATEPEQKAQEEAPKVQLGQTRSLQVENLKDICNLVENVPNGRYFTVKGGYTLATDQGLKQLNNKLKRMDEDSILAKLRVGVHSDVQVTSHSWGRVQLRNPDHLVTEVFGSACSVSYSHESRSELWAPFANLILKASYEATLWAALENACRHPDSPSARIVYLTALGGGVFGNPMEWIADAMRRAFMIFRNTALDVRIVVFYSHVESDLKQLVRDFNTLPAKGESGEREEARPKSEGSEGASVSETVERPHEVHFCSQASCWQTLPCPQHFQ
jgi:hypothetical protein